MADKSDDKTGVIMVDGYRIDRASQKILLRLNTEDWTNASKLREVAELSQNGQVFYRMEEHLIPLDFVLEKPRDDDTGGRGYHNRRQFVLTRSGASWLADHEDEVAQPASRVETQQMAYEALDEAESAKESVQNYRRKVHRIKEYAEDVEGAIEKVQEMLEERSSHRDKIEQKALKAESDAHSVSDMLSKAEDRLSGRIDGVEEQQKRSVNEIGNRLGEVEAEMEGLREENERLRSRVHEMEQEMDKGTVERFLGAGSAD